MFTLRYCLLYVLFIFFFSSRRRHTRCALVTGVQTCALPISHSHNRINCPFHGWAFDLAGKLAGLPGEEYFLDFDKDQVGLQPVHIGEWSDLIFVNFAEEPSKTLEQFLGELVDDFRGYFSPEQWQPEIGRAHV